MLATEILSPSDKHEDITEKVREYLAAGVSLVWVIDPDFCTVLLHRPNEKPGLFNDQHEISAEPHLPGFHLPVARIFADLVS